MASASVDSASDHHQHLHLESLPLIDLRLLSQSELYSLSLCSPSSLSSHRRLDDDLVIPKIDRSVFNESAGSRKQTYSRLRLAPRKSHLLSSSSSSSPAPAPTTTSTYVRSRNPEPLDEENTQIVALLKQLFPAQIPAKDQNLIPVHVEPAPESSDAVFQNVPIGVMESSNAVLQDIPVRIVDDERKGEHEMSNAGLQMVPIGGGGSERKRKRGRPRKNENQVIETESKSEGAVGFRSEADCKIKVEAKDMAIVNRNCVVVDLVALGNLEDPFGEELRKRTQGFRTLEQFLEYLEGVNGEWCSNRKKRKIIDASDFGDALPMGWKLMLCLKKQAGRVWLICSRYISPYGQQFVSCKEVSSYLLSIFGFQGIAQPNSANGADETVKLAHKMISGNAADLTSNDGKQNGDNPVFCSPLPVASTNHERQDNLPLVAGESEGVQRGEVLYCHKCTMTYTEKDDLLHHLLTSHKGSAKRGRSSTSISDMAILKDGKYECQFCHKLFEEKHRYNGHLGVHIKSYVKRLEASAGAGTMQKMVHAETDGVPYEVLKIQEPIEIDEDSVAETCNASVSPHIKIKVDGLNETCAGKYTHELDLLSQDALATKADRTDNKLGAGSSDKQDNHKVGKLDGATDVNGAKFNVCLGAHTSLSKKKNNGTCESPDDTDVVKCGTGEINICVRQERSSQNDSNSLPVNELIDVENATGIHISSIEEHKQAKHYGSDLVAPSGKGNIRGNDNVDDMPFTSTAERMDVDDRVKLGNNELMSGSGNNCRGPDDIATNIKQRGCSLFAFGNDHRGDFLNDVNGNSTSILAESVQEKGSLGGSPTSSVEKQKFVNDNVFRDSTRMLDKPNFAKVSSSWNKELTIGMAANQTTPNDDAVTSSQLGRSFGSCSVVPYWDEPTCKVRNNANPNCSIQESWQDKGFATGLYTPSGNDQTAGFHSDARKCSAGTMDKPKLEDVRKNSESIAFGSNVTELDANVATGIEQEGNFRGPLLASSSSEQALTLKNYGISNSVMEHPKQDRGYESGLRCSYGIEQSCGGNNANKVSCRTLEEFKHENVRSFWNSGLPVALDESHVGPNRNALAVAGTVPYENSKDYSLVRSGNVQMFALGNNATGGASSTIEDFKPKRGPESSFLCLSGGVENNLNAMYAGMVQEVNRLGDAESMRHNDSIVGFANHSRPSEDVMAELMWRTDEENALQNGSAHTSSPMVQSSGSFPTFDIMSDKDGTQFCNVNDKFDGMSGFQGPRSSTMGHLEYSFMSAQTCSSSGDSKVLSYGSDMAQGFDSSVWLQKEALPLLPKIANRHQVTSICVCCRNEFNHEAVDSGAQTSSMGSMCSSCKAKFSGQLSLF